MMTSSSLVWWLMLVATHANRSSIHATRVRVSRHSTRASTEQALSKDGDFASTEQALRVLETGVKMLDVSTVSEGSAAVREAFEMVRTLLSGLEASLGGENIPASVSEGGRKIIVNPPEQMRGELATRSRVPVQWVIDRGASFTFVVESARKPNIGGQISVVCSGFYQLPFDGLSVYARFPATGTDRVATDPAAWAAASPAGKQAALEREESAFYEALEEQRTNPWWGETTYLNSPKYLYSAHNKQMRVWYTIREMMSYGLLLGESQGKALMYQTLLSRPAKMDKIVFANYIQQNSTNELGIRVAFETSVHSHGDTVSMPNGGKMDMKDFYDRFALEEKCNMLFDPDDFTTHRSRVDNSGINFAATMAAGNPAICAKSKDNNGGPHCIEGGKSDKVIKFMKACLGAPTEKGGWESKDNTYGCQGSELGRVVWRRKSIVDLME